YKATDNDPPTGVPSIGQWVQMQSGTAYDICDTIPPAAVTSLGGGTDSPYDHVDLCWIAPADDGSFNSTGPASLYDLRYSTSSINDQNWAQATPLNVQTPSPAGLWEDLLVDGLTPGTTYYFRLKSRDDHSSTGNWTTLSNPFSIRLASPPKLCAGFSGGGGGGGGVVANSEASAVIQGEQVTAQTNENSLFDGAPLGQPISDVLRLPWLEAQGGTYQTWVRSAAPAARAALDQASLLVLDHSPGLSALPLGGQIVLGTVKPATQVLSDDGTDHTAQLSAGNPIA